METAQHWDRLPKNQPAEIAMFQISEVQESPAFNGRRNFVSLRQMSELNQLSDPSSRSSSLSVCPQPAQVVASGETLWRHIGH